MGTVRPCRLAPDSGRGVWLAGCQEPRRALFCRDRTEAFAMAREADVDVFPAFESLLGMSLLEAAPLRGDTRGTEPCVHFQQALAEDPQNHVCRIVHAGIAGDCANSTPVYAWGSQELKAALAERPDQLAAALDSRNGVCIADRPTLTHHLGCMAYCVAIDNSDLLPPFLPWVRNEDGVFGALIEALMPKTVSADLPWGVVHDSPGRNSSTAADSAWRPCVADLVIALLHPAARAVRFGTLAEMTAEVGRAFLRYGEASDSSLKDFCTEVSLSRLRHHLTRISEWQDVFSAGGMSVDSFRGALIRSSHSALVAPPRDLAHSTYENSWDGLRHLFHDFGSLLVQWPALWSAAHAVRKSGQLDHAARGGRAVATVGQAGAEGRDVHAAAARPRKAAGRGPHWDGTAANPVERQAGRAAQPRGDPRQSFV